MCSKMKIKKSYVAPQANACDVECESSFLVVSGSNEVVLRPEPKKKTPMELAGTAVTGAAFGRSDSNNKTMSRSSWFYYLT